MPANVSQFVSNGADAYDTTVTVDISNTDPGGVIHVLVGYFIFDGATVSSITDTQGNTYTRIGTAIAGGGNVSTTHFYAQNIVGGASANTITVNFSATVRFRSVFAKEIRGVAASGALVGSTQQEQNAPGTGADAVTTGNATPSSQPNLFSAWAGSQFYTDNLTQGAGYTSDGWADRNGLASRGISKRTTSTSADDATWTAQYGVQYISNYLAVFKEADPVAAKFNMMKGM